MGVQKKPAEIYQFYGNYCSGNYRSLGVQLVSFLFCFIFSGFVFSYHDDDLVRRMLISGSGDSHVWQFMESPKWVLQASEIFNWRYVVHALVPVITSYVY